MVSLLMFVILVLMQAFRPGPITLDRILGAIVGYLLLGLLWFEAYRLLFLLQPAAFHYALSQDSEYGTHGLAYFSFVTLTTVGYGDITPVDPLARTLAIAEALIGQLYPAILIARLVSMQLMSRHRD